MIAPKMALSKAVAKVVLVSFTDNLKNHICALRERGIVPSWNRIRFFMGLKQTKCTV